MFVKRRRFPEEIIPQPLILKKTFFIMGVVQNRAIPNLIEGGVDL
jgi:hypothetical protein